MPPAKINLAEKLNQFTEHWSPKIIAPYEDYQFKLAKLKGEFVWHSHPESDEAFLVLDGVLRLDFRDGSVSVGQGEMLVVPKGVEHKPSAEFPCQVMVLVRAGTVNTGNAPVSELTSDPTASI
ncbi:cupin domain-containing protein [Blastopirellula marina]|uniref:Cupin type-2 domain-containing protein n=1 Tax=Blastopirellula marina DSM 3645 TaxID=314230 RepID=A3ZX89_9BACT|nr:cupin domain-containing protein [Blastopirellula marina]EAQ78974.1 hypothetical protein DSM3645_27878 [Blastopirellula marina DSM 3645]